MITPDGYIFDKEAVLSYIVDQKKEQKRLMKAYEKYIEMENDKKAQVCSKFINLNNVLGIQCRIRREAPQIPYYRINASSHFHAWISETVLFLKAPA
jgi:hypothetical protein